MGSSDGDESDKLIADPDFSSCGTGWLDKDDSCHRWLQIKQSVGKMKRQDEAYAKLLRIPRAAHSKKTTEL